MLFKLVFWKVWKMTKSWTTPPPPKCGTINTFFKFKELIQKSVLSGESTILGTFNQPRELFLGSFSMKSLRTFVSSSTDFYHSDLSDENSVRYCAHTEYIAFIWPVRKLSTLSFYVFGRPNISLNIYCETILETPVITLMYTFTQIPHNIYIQYCC